jgi:hypothetical protein
VLAVKRFVKRYEDCSLLTNHNLNQIVPKTMDTACNVAIDDAHV